MAAGTHGGNIQKAAERYGVPEYRIVDFSASLNPLGVPGAVKKILRTAKHLLEHYPDAESRLLTKDIADFYSLNEKSILAGNGSAELIYLFAQAVQSKNIGIFQPNFSEYERAFQEQNCAIRNITGSEKDNFKIDIGKCIELLYKEGMARSSVLFLSNPNNPAGHVYSREELSLLLDFCRGVGAYLFVDEAFMDFIEPGNRFSMLESVGKSENLLVLRSFTKIYAIPGIRLGFIAGHENIVSGIRKRQAPWSVNAIAQAIGRKCLMLEGYRRKTRRTVESEKKRLCRELRKIDGITVFDSVTNYILCRFTDDSVLSEVNDYLGRKGIIIRNCADFPGLGNRYFRIAVRCRSENKKLILSLRRYFAI